ncbi:MAG: hypothetical protein HUU43_16070 [Ignavibacteriaceae bacterium]|nr:hypothetical protein [Ignavibacteriaceae bacterium]
MPGVILHNFGPGNENTKLRLYTDSEGSGPASVYNRRLDHFNIFMDGG